MATLQPVSAMYPEVKKISSKIRKLFKTIVPVRGVKFPIDDRFNLVFHDDSSFDLYVIENTLFIPYMEKDRLENLQAFFESMQLPYCIEHEVQHLLDIQYSIQNKDYLSDALFDERASEMELQCSMFLEGNSDNKVYN